MTARFLLISLLLLAHVSTIAAVVDEEGEIERTLHAFLSGANERSVHETFWTEDLVYTSSSGERYGKAEILAGFDDAPQAGENAPVYAGEDVVVRVMGDLAVVTFRLIAERSGARVGEYFNTGVFRKTDGEWKAFTWQATRIPETP